MQLNFNINCEITDEATRADIVHVLEITLPYMADNVSVISTFADSQPTRILDRLAEDPNDYMNVDNRAQAHLINKMRQHGFRDSEIYKVVNLLIDSYAEARK